MDTMTIHFPNGLLGFEEFKDFRLLSSETEKDLHWLQSTQDNQLEFAVTIPSVFQVDYEVTLNSEDEKLLNIDDGDELIILVTLSKKDASEEKNTRLNANFIAPVIINASQKLGIQKILESTQNPVTITMRG